MITRTVFDKINNEAKASIVEALDFIEHNCSLHNYIAIVAEGAYKKIPEGTRFPPYVIDDFENKRKDNTRLDFYVEFLKSYYSFKGYEIIDDDQYRMHIEMMIYSHIWESKPFLEKLFQVSNVLDKDVFCWKPNVPDMSKHDFIRNQIRNAFESKNMSIASIMKKGYHSSLRNAFAHSEYAYFPHSNEIVLYNYKGQGWELNKISFDDWTKRFAYSVFLNYHLLNEIHSRRTSLISRFDTDTFIIKFPPEADNKEHKIRYDESRDTFNFIN